MLPIPTMRLDARDQPINNRFESIREAVNPLYTIAPRTDRQAFDVNWTLWRLDTLVFNHASFTSVSLDHDPRRLGAEDTNHLLLELYLAGSGRGLADETPTFIDPRRIHLIDFSRRYRTNTTSVITKGVLIPHAAVGFDSSRHAPYCFLEADSPSGRVLATAFLSLMNQLPRITQADAPDLAAGFADLVRGLMISPGSGAEPPIVARARTFAMKAYIAGHIADEDLGSARLCQAFNVSRATLYRLFDAAGGIDRYIRGRRLERCFRHLQESPATRGRVRRVAERWGFHDISHFHRLFKDQFRMTPRECLEAGPLAQSADASRGHRSGGDQQVPTLRNFLRRG